MRFVHGVQRAELCGAAVDGDTAPALAAQRCVQRLVRRCGARPGHAEGVAARQLELRELQRGDCILCRVVARLAPLLDGSTQVAQRKGT